MKYKEAIELSQRSEDLIGTIDKKGFVINDVWIVPIDQNLRDKYLDTYMQHKDKEKALKPYCDSELEVWVVDTQFLDKANVLFYDKIDD